MTKKAIISELRDFGIKATYQNICWCRNKNFDIVGGIMFGKNIHFKVENNIVSIVNNYNDIRPLIYA